MVNNMIGKRQLIIDADNTLVNSSETIIDIFRRSNKNIPKFDSKILNWDFSPYLNTPQMQKLAVTKFETQDFYDNLSLFPNALVVLERLKENFEIIICTKPMRNSIEMKEQFIKNYIPHDRIVFLMQDDFDKSFIGKKDSIIIDDKIECLMGGDRTLRILYGEYGYQDEELEREGIKGHKDLSEVVQIANWLDLEKLLELYIK